MKFSSSPTPGPQAITQPTGSVFKKQDSLAWLTATQYLDLLQKREITVLDYAQACADFIDILEPKLSAWAWFDRDRFEALAAKVDKTIEGYRSSGGQFLPGKLTGLPVGVKDIFNTEDMPTSYGSSIFSGYTPGNDARVVTSLLSESAIMAGKTVTAEFAVHTPNGTLNPHDLSRSSGTSSSGSAVAVATAMMPVALASQTAGSIIRPASYCGVFGFKPSYGTIPRTAMLKTTDTMDSVGFMTRSVSDLSLLFDVLRVRGPNYPVVDASLADTARRKPVNRPWRVGILDGPKSRFVSKAVNRQFDLVARKLETAGCELQHLRLPVLFDRAHDTHETIYRRSLSYYFWREWENGKHEFSPRLSEMIDGGTRISFNEYESALKNQATIAKKYDEIMRDFDVVLSPSTADEAPVGLDTPDIPDHCLIFTMCYAPTISVPILNGTSGLPVGIQVAAKRFNDYDLLDFAEFLCCATA